MLERWNNGIVGNKRGILTLLNKKEFQLTQHSNTPVFHYSNFERSEFF
jgi:hypothetical protein